MRGRALVFVVLLASLPTRGWSQSTLNFPKFFSAAELPVSGFAIVNPGSTTANVTFTLFSSSGTVVATSTANCSQPTGFCSVPAAGQRARSGDQIFSALGNGGWVQATSSTSGLQGFWLNYAVDISFIDGAEAAIPAMDEIVPLVAGSTELNVANPNGTANTVQLSIVGEAGIELGHTSVSIPANGVFQTDVAALFPSVPIVSARYIRVTGTASIAATAVIRGYLGAPKDDAVVNGVDHGSTTPQLNFPHVVSGMGFGANYTTDVDVTNLSASAQNITISFNPDTGAAPPPVSVTLSGNGAIRRTAKDLFALDQTVFSSGWIQVTGTAPVTGFAAYEDSVAGGVAVVSAQATPRTQLLFAHIADLPPFLTGLAMLNTNSTAATVKVYAMTPDGSLIGGADNVATAQLTLAPNARTSKLLMEMIPQTQSRTTDGGFIFVTSTAPLYGLELFFNRNQSSLANVPAGAIAPGITFTPPIPPVPLTLTSVGPASVARGGTLTLIGSGFNITASNDTVIFTSLGSTSEVPAATATSTSLTAVVPSNATSGPVQVRTGGQTTSATNTTVDVTASANTLVQSTVIVSGGQTTSNTDIYVPTTGTGALNATVWGIGELNGNSILVGASAVEIPRGTSKLLVVGGTAISQANGSFLTISGSDVTISGAPGGVSYQIGGQPAATVTITVAATATPGPRNIFVTNSNLQVSTITGGIFIR